jgi:hypothetical protein
MGYSRNVEYRSLSNTRINSRAKQFLALIVAIVIGMIISAAVNALPSAKHSVSAKGFAASSVIKH